MNNPRLNQPLKSLYFPLLLLLLAGSACNKPPTEADDPRAAKRILLIQEDASCTAVWLKIVKDGISDSSTIKLLRDTTEILQLHLSGKDTTIYTEGLLPGKQYTFIAKSTELTEKSDVTVRTLDTTKYIITWQKYTALNTNGIGNDVLIVNDSTFYFASDTEIIDSSNGEQFGFGEIVNNDLQFRLVKIVDPFGLNTSTPLNTIMEIDGKVFCCGPLDFLEYKNGKFVQRATVYKSLPYSDYINNMWGSDSSHIYFSASNGFSYLYDGNVIKKNYMGGTHSFQCIYGAQKADGTYEILTAGTAAGGVQNRIVSINTDGTYKADMDTTGLPLPLDPRGIWFRPERKYVIAGWYDAYWRRTMHEGKWEKIVFPAGYRKSGFRQIFAKGLNDIWLLHQDASVYHYNGVHWENLHILVPQVFAFFDGIEVRGNKVALFGSDLSSRCVAYIGTIHK